MALISACLTDQDPAMPAAIKHVFLDTIHRLCLWHVINKFQPLLNELYAMFEKLHFKEKFQSVVHHPLTPGEFEKHGLCYWESLNWRLIPHCEASMRSTMIRSLASSKTPTMAWWLQHNVVRASITLSRNVMLTQTCPCTCSQNKWWSSSIAITWTRRERTMGARYVLIPVHMFVRTCWYDCMHTGLHF